MGTETLLSMQKFIEKDCEGDMTELDAKRESVTALRQLFQDFESQLKCDDDCMSMSSNEIEEQVTEQDATPVIHHSQVSNSVVENMIVMVLTTNQAKSRQEFLCWLL